MKKITLVCLANSYKEGGRCIAGIVLDENACVPDNFLWVRPICDTNHGEIPSMYAQQYHPLDVLELEYSSMAIQDHQVENVLFEPQNMICQGRLSINDVKNATYSFPLLLGSDADFVSIDKLCGITQSICLIRVQKFEVFEEFEQDRAYPKAKLRFEYNQHQYALPISDPVFIAQYKRNKLVLNSATELFLTISLGKLHDLVCRKFVACIFAV